MIENAQIVETGLTDRDRSGVYYADVDPGIFSSRGQYLWYPAAAQGSTNMTVRLGNRLFVVRGASPHVLLPRWVKPTIEALLPLYRLGENWDSYGAKSLDPKTAKTAIDLLVMVMDHETPIPSVVPTVTGGIQFEWHTGGCDLEIEISPTDKTSFTFETDREEPIEGVLPEAMPTLIRSIARLH